MALEKINDTYIDSYCLVAAMCSIVLVLNPKTMMIGLGEFFSGALKGFKEGCHPFLGLDGTFMKGQARGILLSVVALDASKQIFFVAIGVVEVENVES